jgi:hypothetical protein
MAEPPDESTSRASIFINAAPERVYDIVVDVANMGQLSPESTGTIGSPGQLTVGDTFWGTNRKGLWRWATQCTVCAADRGRIFSFDVDAGPLPISRWTYEFSPVDGGCEVTETWEDRRRGGPVTWIGGLILPGPRAAHNQVNIEATLAQLKGKAEQS